MTINGKLCRRKLQYDMNKEATKISAHFLNEKAKYELNEII